MGRAILGGLFTSPKVPSAKGTPGSLSTIESRRRAMAMMRCVRLPVANCLAAVTSAETVWRVSAPNSSPLATASRPLPVKRSTL